MASVLQAHLCCHFHDAWSEPRAGLLARSCYLDALMRGAAGFVHACAEGARRLASQAGEPALNARRRDLVLDLAPALSAWQLGLEQRINDALQILRSGRPLDSRIEGSSTWGPVGQLSLVDDSAIERGLMVSESGASHFRPRRNRNTPT